MSSRRSGSLASLREGNRRLVIEALRERGVASRAELARATDLSRSTISTIVGDLIEAGLAAERDGQPDGEAHAGRPGVMVALDPSAGLALAIDFGHRHLRVAVSDLSHTVLAERWRELDVDQSASEGLSEAANFVDEVLAEAGVERGRVIGAVMGLPAPINRMTGTVWDSSILPGWAGVDAAAEASSRLKLPVVVENDANLGALAELTWGAAKGRSEVAYIKVASGVGGGLIAGGRLSHGVGGTAGEIGHTVVAENGPVCRCGNRGCLETLASARAVTNLLSLSSARADLDAPDARACGLGRCRDAAPDRRRRPRARSGRREPLQHRQPGMRRDRRRHGARRRRAPGPGARGRSAETRFPRPPPTRRSSPACSASGRRCSARSRS